jgi:hypothetical protein
MHHKWTNRFSSMWWACNTVIAVNTRSTTTFTLPTTIVDLQGGRLPLATLEGGGEACPRITIPPWGVRIFWVGAYQERGWGITSSSLSVCSSSTSSLSTFSISTSPTRLGLVYPAQPSYTYSSTDLAAWEFLENCSRTQPGSPGLHRLCIVMASLWGLEYKYPFTLSLFTILAIST